MSVSLDALNLCVMFRSCASCSKCTRCKSLKDLETLVTAVNMYVHKVLMHIMPNMWQMKHLKEKLLQQIFEKIIIRYAYENHDTLFKNMILDALVQTFIETYYSTINNILRLWSIDLSRLKINVINNDATMVQAKRFCRKL